MSECSNGVTCLGGVGGPWPRRLRVGLLDSTLREGEQTPGVSFTVEQKLEIARLLDEIGVSMIEAGHPNVAPDVYEAVKRIIGMKREGVIRRAEIVAHSRAVKKDIEVAAELEPDRIAIFYGVSDVHLKYKHKVTREEALSIIGEMIEYARQHGVRVRFTAEDATRADYSFLLEAVRTAREAGADRVSIADTVGIATPYAIRRLFERLTQDEPGVEYDIHAHNDLGMAVANSLAAVEGGATIIHVTVNGLGERSGIAPLEQVAVALKRHYGIDVVDLRRVTRLSRLVERYSGIPVPPTAPVVGENAFVHKAGVHVAGVLANPETYEPYPPEWVGRSRDYTIDKYTGRRALQARLERLGVRVSEEELVEILRRVKQRSGARWLRDEDLLEIAEEVTGRALRPRPPEEIEALVTVKCEANIYTTTVARRLSIIPGVEEVAEVTGENDILLRVRAKNPVELNQVVEAIRSTRGVRETYTMLVLRRIPMEHHDNNGRLSASS
ncbi:Homocitrate synthase [Pyrodictium delaneyi]|uniref:Homocitrate synthase n=1 Tax=Pyrodictium delaneyi TaxID=1273541 RepID=A0A0P0N4E1_9CREN|nr:homocitrate synthase [Pyrodictium delaneyi]ALL01780.1 Homocitrate synthase [Pyrodictium delaneyi]OWJ55003.1 homocitrate synthase [Pyrodictium delaneyi]